MTPKVSDEYVLEFIQRFQNVNGYAPSVRDVMVAMGVTSPSTAYSRLKKLRDQGWIEWAADRSRTLRLVPQADDAA